MNSTAAGKTNDQFEHDYCSRTKVRMGCFWSLKKYFWSSEKPVSHWVKTKQPEPTATTTGLKISLSSTTTLKTTKTMSNATTLTAI